MRRRIYTWLIFLFVFIGCSLPLACNEAGLSEEKNEPKSKEVLSKPEGQSPDEIFSEPDEQKQAEQKPDEAFLEPDEQDMDGASSEQYEQSPKEAPSEPEKSTPKKLEGVVKWKGLDPKLPNDDLQSLSGIFTKAKILALGESAHGSVGYSQAHTRMIKFAVEKFGYRRILMEVLSDSRVLNQYVQTCKGDLWKILYNNPWKELHIERMKLYQWLCKYNQANPNKKVSVHSVDPQKPWEDMPLIRTFLKKVSTTLDKTYGEKLQTNCFGANDAHQIDWAYKPETSAYHRTKSLPEGKHKACLEAADGLALEMKKKSSDMTQKTSKVEYLDAVDALRSLKAWQEKSYFLFKDTKKALAIREKAFGPSVLWKWERNNPNKWPAILVAHNLHIAKKPLIVASTRDPWVGLETVGVQLARALGEGYGAIAQTGYKVSAMFVKGFYPIHTHKDSLDLLLEPLGDVLFVDTKTKWVKEKGNWRIQEEMLSNGREYNLSSSFDGVLFHKHSAAAIRLKSAP